MEQTTKLMIAIVCTLFSVSLFAQTETTSPDVQQLQQKIDQDIAQLKADKEKLIQDLKQLKEDKMKLMQSQKQGNRPMLKPSVQPTTTPKSSTKNQ